MTVRDVRDALAGGGRDLAHTTVITMLGTMVDKGQIEKLEPTQCNGVSILAGDPAG
jgi:BlaI family transcriptional regulator, penicillinase repressor